MISFILNCRLENVLAVGISISLLIFFSATRMVHAFNFGMLDFIFILLPVGILGAKCLLHVLFAPGDDENLDTKNFLTNFFKPFLKIIRDWFPFLLLCACYYSLYSNFILRINPHLADATLAGIDARLLGNQPSLLLEPIVKPWLTDFLYAIYFSHVVFFPGVALYFYLKKEEQKFRRLMMGFLTIMIMGVVSYILVPAVGPETFLASQYKVDLAGNILSRDVSYIIDVGRVGNDCFPSLHVGIPLLLSFYIRDYRRKFFIPVLIYVGCMCFATIYLRYHYLIDVIAAFAFAPAAYFANDFLLLHWPGEKLSGLAAEIKRPRHNPCINVPDAAESAQNE
ncbi:MAG TPA: phosphatase PAP2 family protein [Verrucomicrobiae bacterium]|nr:phosphatase PAP2 family protein [Verrucomicrobiae bacterium]